MATVKVLLSRLSESNRATLIVSSSDGESIHQEFLLPWISTDEWKTIFLFLELYARDKSTWPTNVDILSIASNLNLFIDKRPSNRRLEVIGSRLYNAIFSSENTRRLFSHLLSKNADEIPIVQLHISEKGSILQAYPWELLHDGEKFLFDSRRAFMVRYIDFPEPLSKIELSEALKVLLLDPRPDILNDYHYDRLPLLDRPYLERLSNQFPGQFAFSDLALTLPNKATLEQLRQYLITSQKNSIHIVHIDTHGNYGWLCSCEYLNAPNAKYCKNCNEAHSKDQIAQGFLAFQTNDGKAKWIDGDQLGKQLYGRGIKVVVVSSCKSGLVAGSSTFSSIAGALIKHGIPAVVAMQFSIDSQASEIFVENFYTALMMGYPLTEAVAEARLGLSANCEDSWYRPVLYLRTDLNNYRGNIFIPSFSIENKHIFSELGGHNHLKIETGTMSPDSAFYIERELDRACLDYLSQPHAVTIAIRAPRQMGKSSLVRRVTYLLKVKYDYHSVYVDFQKFPEQLFKNEEAFLIEFCLMIGDALGITENIDEFWSSKRRTNLMKCTYYFRDYIIPKAQVPFILAMDEVERVLNSPFQNDFFGMLRTWHNDRALDENLAKVSLFLSSSTEPHLFIDNPNQSPFNVAAPTPSLGDFSQVELNELNRRYKAPLGDQELTRLYNLLGGHPFLSRLAFYLLASGKLKFDKLEETATLSSGPFGDHLNHYWKHISEMPEMKHALAQICNHQAYPQNKLYYRLKGAGLIKRVGSKVVMRNGLYTRFFTERINE